MTEQEVGGPIGVRTARRRAWASKDGADFRLADFAANDELADMIKEPRGPKRGGFGKRRGRAWKFNPAAAFDLLEQGESGIRFSVFRGERFERDGGNDRATVGHQEFEKLCKAGFRG